jgi:Holliday junction DNA helicase RuvA
MIGRLHGTILEKQPPELVLDVNGVGYEVSVPMSTFYRLPETGQEITLYTHFTVREDAHHLFGFSTLSERKLFRSLIKVNGVGPKLALTILSSIDPDTFVQSIVDNNAAALIRLPGIGKKTAERLIIEMRDRLTDWYDTAAFEVNSNAAVQIAVNNLTGSVQEAINALIALGYKPAEASRAVNRTGLMQESNCEIIIRSALKLMAGA